MKNERELQDGIHALVPKEKMEEHIRKFRDTYAMVPGAPFYRHEFGFYCLEEWAKQGLDPDADLDQLFQLHKPARHCLGKLGWCEADFEPSFEEKLIEDRGEHEVVQDRAGRKVLYFKGRRSGFMPTYLDHPVKGWKTWEENVKWRLNSDTPERYSDLEERMATAKKAAGRGELMCVNAAGGYMYLRSLFGPEDLLYAFYDEPELIHDCMQSWLKISDVVTAKHQQYVTVDEVFLAEDICYNHSSLISLDMINEFLMPYYQQFVSNIRSRQIDSDRHLYVQIDTDGAAHAVIPIYQQGIGMDVMSPFEVASGCDVVQVAKEYPDLVISGGIDKRILAKGIKEIDEMVERIIPVLRERGGYTPTCDHGVPAEVPFVNYMHYRKRCIELGG